MQPRGSASMPTPACFGTQAGYCIVMRRALPVLLLLLASCGRTPAPAAGVLATVNGVAITAAELDQLGRPGHGNAATPDPGDGMLQTAIRQELAAQKAIELGLDADPG